MTIVCYDGKTIAADKMSRVRGEDGKRRVKSLEKEKITTGFKHAHFEGERIQIIGRAGLTKLSTETIAFLMSHKTINTLKAHLEKKFPEGVSRGCRMLIVTQNSVFRVRVTPKFEIEHMRYKKTKQVAIGTPQKTAEFLMRKQNIAAQHVVSIIQGFAPGCGGGVDYTSRFQVAAGSAVRHIPPFEDSKQQQLHYLRHARERIDELIKKLE